MSVLYDWPSGLVANAVTLRLDARTRGGGEGVQGREQVVSSGLGRWVATVTCPLYNRTSILAHATLLALLDGRANTVKMPICPGPLGSRVLPLINGVPYAGLGLNLKPGQLPESLGVAPTVATTAAAGATEIIINAGTLVGLEPGVMFGLGERFYQVIEMHGAVMTTIRFRPKLRFTIGAGTAVNWKRPRCVMRLRSDDSGAAEIQLSRTGTATFDFAEGGW